MDPDESLIALKIISNMCQFPSPSYKGMVFDEEEVTVAKQRVGNSMGGVGKMTKQFFQQITAKIYKEGSYSNLFEKEFRFKQKPDHIKREGERQVIDVEIDDVIDGEIEWTDRFDEDKEGTTGSPQWNEGGAGRAARRVPIRDSSPVQGHNKKPTQQIEPRRLNKQHNRRGEDHKDHRQ